MANTPGDTMRWASALAMGDNLLAAVASAAREVRDQLDGGDPSLVLAFVSPHHRAVWDALPRLLAGEFPAAARVGASGGGVIGAGHEVEDRAALSLTAAVMPGVEVRPFSLGDGQSLDDLDLGSSRHEALVVLPEPSSEDLEGLLAGFDRRFPESIVVGGLASGARHAGENLLFAGDTLRTEGLVGLALSGDVAVDSIVAQGCRPIGNPMFVTRCEDGLLLEIDGRRPIDVLHELFESLTPRDQELLRYSLFLGLVMESERSTYGPGDYLVRNIVGIDPESGVLVVGARLTTHQVVQFHLRDAEASAEDLRSHLALHRSRHLPPPSGALLFSCLGRGRGLYQVPDHDSRALATALGPIPIGGFFCNGEIGRVQGRTYLHGYTSSIALFRSRS